MRQNLVTDIVSGKTTVFGKGMTPGGGGGLPYETDGDARRLA